MTGAPRFCQTPRREARAGSAAGPDHPPVPGQRSREGAP